MFVLCGVYIELLYISHQTLDSVVYWFITDTVMVRL